MLLRVALTVAHVFFGVSKPHIMRREIVTPGILAGGRGFIGRGSFLKDGELTHVLITIAMLMTSAISAYTPHAPMVATVGCV